MNVKFISKEEILSFLGVEEKCHMCGAVIQSGEEIEQIFRGRAIQPPYFHEDSELAIKAEDYQVYHVNCIKIS